MITQIVFKILDKKDYGKQNGYKIAALNLKGKYIFYKNQKAGFIEKILKKKDGLYGIAKITKLIALPGLQI